MCIIHVAMTDDDKLKAALLEKLERENDNAKLPSYRRHVKGCLHDGCGCIGAIILGLIVVGLIIGFWHKFTS